MMPLSEAQFQNTLLDLLHAYDYLAHAERPAINQRGKWSTPIQGDKGYFDITAVHPGKKRILFIEVKTNTGKMRPAQIEWRNAVLEAGGEYILARPQDYERLTEELK